MTVFEFLTDLQRRDIRLWAEAGRLRCSAPLGVLTPDLQTEISNRKPELLAFLRSADTWSGRQSAVVPVQPRGSRAPFFGVPGHNGDVFCYVPLSRHLGLDQPLFALEPPGVDGRAAPMRRIEDLATYLVEELRRFQPQGPYRLGGYCLGGVTAFEMARQLRSLRQEVPLLALFETTCPTSFRPWHRVTKVMRQQGQRVARHFRAISRLGPHGQVRYAIERLAKRWADRTRDDDPSDPRHSVVSATLSAVHRYVPGTYPGRVDLFLAGMESIRLGYGRPLDWARLALEGTTIHVGPGCDANSILRDPNVGAVAERLRECLAHD